jgi:hypothetical protein
MPYPFPPHLLLSHSRSARAAAAVTSALVQAATVRACHVVAPAAFAETLASAVTAAAHAALGKDLSAASTAALAAGASSAAALVSASIVVAGMDSLGCLELFSAAQPSGVPPPPRASSLTNPSLLATPESFERMLLSPALAAAAAASFVDVAGAAVAPIVGQFTVSARDGSLMADVRAVVERGYGAARAIPVPAAAPGSLQDAQLFRRGARGRQPRLILGPAAPNDLERALKRRGARDIVIAYGAEAGRAPTAHRRPEYAPQLGGAPLEVASPQAAAGGLAGAGAAGSSGSDGAHGAASVGATDGQAAATPDQAFCWTLSFVGPSCGADYATALGMALQPARTTTIDVGPAGTHVHAPDEPSRVLAKEALEACLRVID